MTPFTISDMTETTGAPPQWFKRWAEDGTLEPAAGTRHGGKGVHRSFSNLEFMIAAVLARLVKSGVAMPAVRVAAEQLRKALSGIDTPRRARWTGDDPWRAAYHAVLDGRQAYFVAATFGGADWKIGAAPSLDLTELPDSEKADGLVVINLANVWQPVMARIDQAESRDA